VQAGLALYPNFTIRRYRVATNARSDSPTFLAGRDRAIGGMRMAGGCLRDDVGNGSWLCENAKALDRYRRSYSSKTVSGIQFENTFDLEIELKNVILVAFRFFSFLHSQGQKRPSEAPTVTSVLRP
jgi:hypothetical protein